MKQSFEDYLKEIHAGTYNGTDDDMPDAFDNWEPDVDEVIAYAQDWGLGVFKEGIEKGRYDLICEIQPQMDKLKNALGETLDPVVINELTEKN